jgi:hypothetical protein
MLILLLIQNWCKLIQSHFLSHLLALHLVVIVVSTSSIFPFSEFCLFNHVRILWIKIISILLYTKWKVFFSFSFTIDFISFIVILLFLIFSILFIILEFLDIYPWLIVFFNLFLYFANTNWNVFVVIKSMRMLIFLMPSFHNY